MEEKYKGIHGFKNGAPAYPHDAWQGVQLFIDTWGFLPNDEELLNKLTREELTTLCMMALDASSRIDLGGSDIRKIQEFMHQHKISPDSLTNKK